MEGYVEKNAQCTGSNGLCEPVTMFYGEDVVMSHCSGAGADAIYSHAIFTHTACERTDGDGICRATGERCNAPNNVTGGIRLSIGQSLRRD